VPVNVQTEEEETQAVYIMLILYRTVNTEIPSEIRDFEEYLCPPHPPVVFEWNGRKFR